MYIFYLIQFYFTNIIILPFFCFPFIYLKKKSLIDFFLLRWDKLIWHHCYKAEETGQRRHARGAIIKDLQMYALQMCRFCRFFFTWKCIKLGQKDSFFSSFVSFLRRSNILPSPLSVWLKIYYIVTLCSVVNSYWENRSKHNQTFWILTEICSFRKRPFGFGTCCHFWFILRNILYFAYEKLEVN